MRFRDLSLAAASSGRWARPKRSAASTVSRCTGSPKSPIEQTLGSGIIDFRWAAASLHNGVNVRGYPSPGQTYPAGVVERHHQPPNAARTKGNRPDEGRVPRSRPLVLREAVGDGVTGRKVFLGGRGHREDGAMSSISAPGNGGNPTRPTSLFPIDRDLSSCASRRKGLAVPHAPALPASAGESFGRGFPISAYMSE
jgi:hypothetical protein